MNCVLDASVVVGIFTPQPRSDESIAFIARTMAQEGQKFLAPDCFYYEVAATLRKCEQTGAYTGFVEDLNKFYTMPVVITSCKDLMQDAARISRENLISPYDSFYLALAQRESLPLITADDRLVGGTRGKGFDVRSVADM